MEGQPEETVLNQYDEVPGTKLRDPFDDATPELDQLAQHARETYGLEVTGGDIQIIE